MTSHYTSSSLNAHGRHYAQQISRPGPTTLSLQARRLERRTVTPSRFGVNAPVCRGTLLRKHIWRYLLSRRARSVGCLRKYLPICPYCLVSFLSPFLTLRGRFVASLVTLGVHAPATTLGCYCLLTQTLQLRYTLPYLPLVYIPMYTYTDIQREREIAPAALM